MYQQWQTKLHGAAPCFACTELFLNNAALCTWLQQGEIEPDAVLHPVEFLGLLR